MKQVAQEILVIVTFIGLLAAFMWLCAGCERSRSPEHRCAYDLNGVAQYRNCHVVETRDDSGNQPIFVQHTQCEVVCIVHDKPAERP